MKGYVVFIEWWECVCRGGISFMGERGRKWYVIKMEKFIWNRFVIEERNDRYSLFCFICVCFLEGNSVVKMDCKRKGDKWDYCNFFDYSEGGEEKMLYLGRC